MLVVGVLETNALLNFVMQEERTVVSLMPTSSMAVTDFFKLKGRTILRVYFYEIARQNRYFEYTAYDTDSERRLDVFARALTQD